METKQMPTSWVLIVRQHAMKVVMGTNCAAKSRQSRHAKQPEYEVHITNISFQQTELLIQLKRLNYKVNMCH